MGKPDMNQFYDKCIKEALNSKANGITPSGALLGRISSEINDKKKENISMNKILQSRMMKPIIIAALVLILTTTAGFAATQISSFRSSSTPGDDFDQFPTAQQVEKAVNYVPDYVESFSNGFYFKDAAIDNTEALDADNNKVREYKGISFHYTKEDAQKGQSMSLSTDLEGPGLVDPLGPNEEEISYGDIKLTYSQKTFKVFGEDYTPTEEENQQIEQGLLWISYGDKTETSIIQYVSWVKDGIVYNLMDNGYGVEKDEFLDMAKEVID
ncbi:MAG: hypothetical protein PHE79_03825 [Eubacteriales bacterium]|nr:hypothetical protein [Eubacteriales bacterium]